MSPARLTVELVAAVRALLPPEAETVPLQEPHFEGNEWRYVKQCLDSGWVSSAGAFVDDFETRLAEVTEAPFAVATVNGTAALHLCLLGAGVASGDEVIAPSLTFVATANAIAYCGAIPHFADCEERGLGLDPAKLAVHLEAIGEPRQDGLYNRHTGRRIAAVLATHVLGHPSDLDPLVALCDAHGLPFVEDAAEALGSRYNGRHVGCHGRLGALSFNGNKILTTGGGGAVLTRDEALARRLKHLSTTARLPHPWHYEHDAVGYNYRLPNINAALGCAQLEGLPRALQAKRRLAERYRRALEPVEGVAFFAEPSYAESNYWLNAVTLEAAAEEMLETCLKALHAEGILARPAWQPMHRLPMYAEAPRMALDMTESMTARLICLPSSVPLVDEETDAAR